MVLKLVEIVPDVSEVTEANERNGRDDDISTKWLVTDISQGRTDVNDSVWIYHNEPGLYGYYYGHSTQTKSITTIKDRIWTTYRIADLRNEDETFEVFPNPTDPDSKFQYDLRNAIVGTLKYGGTGDHHTSLIAWAIDVDGL
ncbi:hypothetical protein V865_008541 [Kwoniella europaea PYCC6329]|uniref:Uncharacterized protein n=1 Tax=Kwoniella europaea PYCC6329 TaxID=1423913 RepID=A0AAX4KXR9_9TREE